MNLTPFRVCRFRSQLQFFIRLYQKILGPLRMPAQLIIVSALGSVDPLPRLYDKTLSSAQVAVSRADVYHRSLRKQHAAAEKRDTYRDGNQQAFFRHDYSPLEVNCELAYSF